MKKLIYCLFIFSSYIVIAQDNINTSQALNIASKQNMLSQRISKEKLFKITNPNNIGTKQVLGLSLIQFEKNIALLKEAKLPAKTLYKITTLEMLWIGFKENILKKDHSTAIKTTEFNEVMLSNSNAIFNDVLNFSKKNFLYPYNTFSEKFPDAYKASNDLKFLSQKLSLYYNASFSKILKDDVLNLEQTFIDIEANVKKISAYKETNKDIKDKTIAIENKWNSFKPTIKKAIQEGFSNSNNHPKPEFINNVCNELLKNADLLTRLYKQNNIVN